MLFTTRLWNFDWERWKCKQNSSNKNELLMFILPCIIVIVEEWKTNLMSLAILFHFLCAQHVSDINISIIRSSRLCWITTSVLQPAKRTLPKTSHTKSSNTQRTENKTTDVVIHQHSRELLMMDISMSETCWAHKKWNKIASDIKLVFHSSITSGQFACIVWSVTTGTYHITVVPLTFTTL